MSIYNVECVRVDGEIMAYVKTQDDWSGAITGNLKKIFLTGNDYYCHAERRRVIVNDQRRQLLNYEDKVKTALEWYNKTKF